MADRADHPGRRCGFRRIDTLRATRDGGSARHFTPHGQKPSRSSKLECPPTDIYLAAPAQFLKYFAFEFGSRGTYERSSYRRDSDRHRRLDLRALAGNVLPRQTAAET